MPWGQEEREARQAATALFQSVGAIQKDLARLQEQQRADNSRYREIREDIAIIREKVQAIEIRNKDYEELMGRIQHIETMLTTFGADFGRSYVSQKDFESYQLKLQQEADNLRVEMAIAKAKQKEKIWRLAGGLIASFVVGLASALPMVYEWLAALIERLLD